jgi:carbon-monoxide dehydrogenase catalytic subunit
MAEEEKEVVKEMIKKKRAAPKSIDPATLKMIARAEELEIETIFDRADKMKPCPIGSGGTCCQNCGQGPCRLPLPKGGIEGKDERKGLCGATANTIAARNFIRMIAGGAAAHSDHGRGVAETFLAAAKKETEDYVIKDTKKLLEIAPDFGVALTEGKGEKEKPRKIDDIAVEVGERALAQWGQQEGEVLTARRAPEKRIELWRDIGAFPRGIDREIVEIMHRTHIGVDQDYKNLMFQGTRAAIADGWGGSMIATDLQDILFGTPYPIKSQANLGVLREDMVNLVIHGHEPLLSEMIVVASELPEMQELAKKVGANGIQLSGICCTANEIVQRHGVPLAGNFLMQELAIITGAVDAMVVDIQCIMENVANVAACFHTKLITTMPIAKMEEKNVIHMEFHEEDALKTAKKIVKTAIENFPKRKTEIMIPDEKSDLICGFSYEAINYHLGGTFRGSYTPLNQNIINGRIRGIGGVVGCNNARTIHNNDHITVLKELIKNDVIVAWQGS